MLTTTSMYANDYYNDCIVTEASNDNTRDIGVSEASFLDNVNRTPYSLEWCIAYACMHYNSTTLTPPLTCLFLSP